MLGGRTPPFAVVAIESVVDVAEEPGVKLAGLNVGLDAEGRPEAKKEIAFVKPPGPGVNVMVKFAVCPAVTVTEEVVLASAKS